MTELSAARALSTMQRLWSESPDAFEDFLEWCAQPRHTQTISLQFSQGRLTLARLETTSARKQVESLG